MITKISAYIMPFVILIIVGYGMYKKSDNYDNFVNGAEDEDSGFNSTYTDWAYGCGWSIKSFWIS